MVAIRGRIGPAYGILSIEVIHSAALTLIPSAALKGWSLSLELILTLIPSAALKGWSHSYPPLLLRVGASH